jgi:hypothetical protein
LHDLATLDRRGVPGCAVITTPFKDAAASQGGALGFDPEVIWVAHPVQNLTSAQLRGLAESAVEGVLAACSPPQGSDTQ